jgi:hypothetical protein
MAKMIKSASPSSKKLLQLEETANLVARRATNASPRASPLGRLWVTAEMMKPEESLEEKLFVPKFSVFELRQQAQKP